MDFLFLIKCSVAANPAAPAPITIISGSLDEKTLLGIIAKVNPAKDLIKKFLLFLFFTKTSLFFKITILYLRLNVELTFE